MSDELNSPQPKSPAPATALLSTSATIDTLGRRLAVAFFTAAALVPIVFVLWKIVCKTVPPFTGAGAAAYIAVLLAFGLILMFPSVLDDENGGTSTMRVLCLAIVFSFCVIALHTAWSAWAIPPLESNWVWLVTAALGGKALQKYSEVKKSS
jgi:hypothetical protein